MSSRSSSPKTDPAAGRLSNLLGAWALAVSDRVGAAASGAAGRGGQAPAALVALHEFAGGGTIEDLRALLGLTHSAAVRLVDSLVADGYLARRGVAGDRRAVSIVLTTSGRAAARRVRRARAQAVEATLDGLTDAERRVLTTLAERLAGDLAALRLEERRRDAIPAGGWLCRLCDFEACGRPEGRCPAANRAASLTST